MRIFTLLLIGLLLCSQSAIAQYYPYLYMEDSTDYSRPFLMGIEDYQVELGKVELIGDKMISSGIDTFPFPETPKVGETYMLFSAKGDVNYFLSITRENYTQIKYDLWIEGGDIAFNQSGDAHLPTSFFMGSETDESSISGMSYPVYEYSDASSDCALTMRFGHEEESGESLLGSFILSGKGDCLNISLGSIPTMVGGHP